MSPRPPESQSTALVSCHLGSQCLQPIIQWLACINCQARRAAEMPSPAFLWFALAPASTARCPAALLLGAAAASQALLSCRSLSCPSRPTSLLSWQEQPWSCLGARHSLSLRGSSRSRELPHHPQPLSFCCPCRTGDAVVLCRQELFFSPSSSSSFWTSYNCERDWSSMDHRPVLLCTPAVMEVEVTLQPGQQAEGSLGSPADGFPECNSGHTYR